jgi:hypothetical protein
MLILTGQTKVLRSKQESSNLRERGSVPFRDPLLGPETVGESSDRMLQGHTHDHYPPEAAGDVNVELTVEDQVRADKDVAAGSCH